MPSINTKINFNSIAPEYFRTKKALLEFWFLLGLYQITTAILPREYETDAIIILIVSKIGFEVLNQFKVKSSFALYIVSKNSIPITVKKTIAFTNIFEIFVAIAFVFYSGAN